MNSIKKKEKKKEKEEEEDVKELLNTLRKDEHKKTENNLEKAIRSLIMEPEVGDYNV